MPRKKAELSSVSGLKTIPGIGDKMAQDLRELGIQSVEALKGKDPEKMYDEICALCGHRLDRCVLYVYRCAVYYASNKKHDPEKLKWWKWKD